MSHREHKISTKSRMVIYGAITSSISLNTSSTSAATSIFAGRWKQSLVAGIMKGAVNMKMPACHSPSPTPLNSCHSRTAAALAAVASIMVVSFTPEAHSLDVGTQQQQEADTLANIPQLLSGECVSGSQDCKKPRIQRPKSKQAESCTVKCVNTCIRGGLGSPGEGPLNVRRPLVVFKQGFRSRQYCLVECSDICNLLKDGDDGP